MRVETARSIRPYRIRRRAGPPIMKINRDRRFPGPHGPAPWTPQLAPREGRGPERPFAGAAGSPRSSRGRSHGRPRPTGNRAEGLGRPYPPGTAPVGAMGYPRQFPIRAVPAEVCGDELALDRPLGPRPHEEDSAGRESGPPVPKSLLAVRGPRRLLKRGVHHRERGPHDGPFRLPEGPSGANGDRMARPPPEEGWGMALLPLADRDARLLGGPCRLRGDPLRGEDAADPPINRTRRGILSRATVVPGGTHALPSVVPAPLSRPLLLRHPGRT